MPSALGLETLIDDSHRGFNGMKALLAATPSRKLVGLEFDSAEPAPFTPVLHGEKSAGHTFRSVYSPALKRAIALATLDVEASAPGTVLSLTLPATMARPELRKVSARVTRLPFLPTPVSIET